MIPYPSTLPLEDIQTLIDDIRSGNLVGDKVKFAKAVWELAGYALKVSLGDVGAVATAPKSPFHFFGSGEPLSDNQVADYLETAIAPHKFATALPIPWILILKWALTALSAAL